MNVTESKQFVEDACGLLESVEIDIDKLQEQKKKLYPQMTDSDFARLLGVTPATYSDYKSKEKAALPSLKVALKAAFALNLDLKALVPQANQIEEFFLQNIR